MKYLLSAALCVAAVSGCTDREAQRQAQETAQAQAKEHDADALAKQYDEAVKAENWDMARAHGAAVLEGFPGTAAAIRIEPGYADIKAKGEQARELRRMQALWQYSQVPAKGGTQRSAMIDAKSRVDVDGSGPKPVSLVFRDHPQWKRHSYLVLKAGDFNCYRGCKVQVSADGGAPRAMAAHRPDTDEAIAMFIDDDKALWTLVRNAKRISIAFPVKAGGTRTAEFDVGGLETTQMPGWK
ncbi:hypothetical protein CPBF426_33360 [Xanthomonas arboricola pv. juglandis]|uniref:hypothetical protein n=1 Tax=Xanthomonas TaxID=338 RepID=UPI000E5A5E7A|nr:MULTISPECIES: hypothetical protein [Xanthomonas]CAD1787646.1 hypothetical protein XSP_000669 [Xanthomonas sp. CPBF 426]CAG2084591.1 hypothetical protein XCY_000666 [Xanthomonas euroxanthea]SYZ55905.1 hypothetical protein CPBF426_33360 [Xanthomonas arboricola pv. juglandis]